MEAPQLEDSDARLAFRLGKAVHERRMNLHLSQDDLATRVGITQPALAEIEAGQALSTIPVLQLISAALSAELVIDIAAQKEG